MVDHITLGVDAAHPNAGVGAAQVDTGQGGGALSIDDALGTARGWGTIVARVAGADGATLLLMAVGIGSTGAGVARVGRLGVWHAFWDRGTLDKRVAGVGLVTHTDGIMVEDRALGVNATSAGARVHTLGVDACLVAWAVVVEEALRLASLQRVALVVADTGADGLTGTHAALGVGATG